MSESVLIHENTTNSIPAEKVLKKTRLDLQKRFPKYCVSQMLGGQFLRLGIPFDRLSIHQELDEVGKTQVDW